MKYFSYILLVCTSLMLSGCELGFVSFGSKDTLGGTDVTGRPLKPAVDFSMTAPKTVELGICTEFKIQGVDKSGLLGFFLDAAVLELSTISGTGGRFYLDSNCTKEVSELDLPRGESSVSFYMKAFSQQSYSISANSTGFGFRNASLTVTRNPQVLSYLNIPTTLGGGRCSGAFIVQVQDGLGVPFQGSSLLAGVRVSIQSAAGGHFYSDPNCLNEVSSLALDSTGTATYYLQTDRIVPQLSVSAAVVGIEGVSPASTSIAISRAVTHFAVMGGPAADLELDECNGTAFIVEARDVEDQPVAVDQSIRLDLEIAGGSAFFYANAGCNGSTTSLTFNPGNTTKELYLRPQTFNGLTIKAVNTGFGEAVMNKNVLRLPKELFFTTIDTSIRIGECSQARLAVRDKLSNIMGTNLTATLSENKNGQFFSNANCTTALPNNQLVFSANDADVNARRTFYFRDTALNENTVLVTATSVNPNLSVNRSITIEQKLRPDFQFNNGNAATPRVRNGRDEHVEQVVRIGTDTYLVGHSGISSGDERLIIVKLNSVGSDVDEVQFQFNGARTAAFAAVAQGNKIVAAGYAGDSLILVRFDTSLDLDNTFGVNGVVEVSLGSNSRANALVQMSNGDLIAVGSRSGNQMVAVRTSSSGSAVISKDDYFTVGNLLFTSYASGAAVQGNNVIVTGTGNGRLMVARINSSLNLDTNFGPNNAPAMNDGAVILDIVTGVERGEGVAVDSNGDIFVVGAGTSQAFLVKLSNNGVETYANAVGASKGFAVAINGNELLFAGDQLRSFSKSNGSLLGSYDHGGILTDLLLEGAGNNQRIYSGGYITSVTETLLGVKAYPF